MNSVNLKIQNNFLDSFYYMGRLFVITRDRKFSFITQGQLFEKYIKRFNGPENNLLQSILFNNKSVAPSNDYDSNANFKVFFDRTWDKFVSENFEFEIQNEDLTFLCAAPEREPLDFVMYGKRALVANRDGIYECILDIEVGRTNVEKPFIRIFDSKSISLNPRVGEILVTTKMDGLFRASLSSLTERIKVQEKPFEEKATRVAWSYYNFLSYFDSEDIKLHVNETTEDATSNLSSILKEDDGTNSSRRVSGFVKSAIDLDKTLPINLRNEIIFSFNSFQYCFFVTKPGNIFYCRINDTGNGHERLHSLDVGLDIKTLGSPLSAIPILGGTVYEFFTKVVFIKNNKEISISEVESKQIRNFGYSLRYQNIISILTENHLEVHSLFPYSIE